jgi:hypothetical protein
MCNIDFRCHRSTNQFEGRYLNIAALNAFQNLNYFSQDTQERTRKRIKEDLKDSSCAYNEYAETMLPKLKNRYAKKYSEVEVRPKMPPFYFY